MTFCVTCNQENKDLSVYPCGHGFNKCCTDKFLKISLDCPICVEPRQIYFPVTNIKIVFFFQP